MKKEYILVIDSGLGGINILNDLRKSFFDRNFIYVLDNKNSPYGEKTKSELVKISLEIVKKYISKFNVRLIVFACNTLTSVAIDHVRRYLESERIKTLKKLLTSRKLFRDKKLLNRTLEFEKMLEKLEVVGIEPPIKQVNPNEKTLILSTKQTLKSNTMLKKYQDNKNFTFLALKDIAKMLDENFFDRTKIKESLKKQIKIKDYNNIVLGCTHYYYLKKEIEEVLNNFELHFFSAQEGVLKRVQTLLLKDFSKTDSKKNNQRMGNLKIFLTKKDKKLLNIAKNIAKIEL